MRKKTQMDSKTFWKYVDTKKENLIEQHKDRVSAYLAGNKDVKALRGQPLDGKCLYIVSIENLDKGTTSGMVSEATYRLAAQRLLENTHQVASPEDIAMHLSARESEGQELQRQYEKKNRPFPVNVMPGQPVSSSVQGDAHEKASRK